MCVCWGGGGVQLCNDTVLFNKPAAGSLQINEFNLLLLVGVCCTGLLN